MIILGFSPLLTVARATFLISHPPACFTSQVNTHITISQALKVSSSHPIHHLVFLLNTHILLAKAFSNVLTAQYSLFKALLVCHKTFITLSSKILPRVCAILASAIAHGFEPCNILAKSDAGNFLL
jgi:hypothetical protein